jgi:hypothetical protein
MLHALHVVPDQRRQHRQQALVDRGRLQRHDRFEL